MSSTHFVINIHHQHRCNGLIIKRFFVAFGNRFSLSGYGDYQQWNKSVVKLNSNQGRYNIRRYWRYSSAIFIYNSVTKYSKRIKIACFAIQLLNVVIKYHVKKISSSIYVTSRNNGDIRQTARIVKNMIQSKYFADYVQTGMLADLISNWFRKSFHVYIQ